MFTSRDQKRMNIDDGPQSARQKKSCERLDAVKRDRSRCRRAGATGGDGRCASNGGFLNGRARRLGPFSTVGARRLQAFVHYRSSHIFHKTSSTTQHIFR